MTSHGSSMPLPLATSRNWRTIPVPNWKETPDQNDIVVVLWKSMVSPVVKFMVLPAALLMFTGRIAKRLMIISEVSSRETAS